MIVESKREPSRSSSSITSIMIILYDRLPFRFSPISPVSFFAAVQQRTNIDTYVHRVTHRILVVLGRIVGIVEIRRRVPLAESTLPDTAGDYRHHRHHHQWDHSVAHLGCLETRKNFGKKTSVCRIIVWSDYSIRDLCGGSIVLLSLSARGSTILWISSASSSACSRACCLRGK